MGFKGEYILKGIPPEVHRRVKVILAGQGRTLKEFLLDCMRRLASGEIER